MRTNRAAAFLALTGCALGAAWSCSPFDGSPLPVGTDGGAPDSSPPDSSVKDVADADADADAAAPRPCSQGGGTVVYSSSFEDDAGPTLAGWTVSATPRASVEAVSASDGRSGAAKATVLVKSEGPAYAVISRASVASLPTDFAVQFSFTAPSLPDSYIVHQLLAAAPTSTNFTLGLRAGNWELTADGQSVVVGSKGTADGVWHTLAYRVERREDAIHVEAMFDGVRSTLDLPRPATYNSVQLGPFWASSDTSPGAVITYDDVTVWSCTTP